MASQTSGINLEIVVSCILQEYIKLRNDSPVAKNRRVVINLQLKKYLVVDLTVKKKQTKK